MTLIANSFRRPFDVNLKLEQDRGVRLGTNNYGIDPSLIHLGEDWSGPRYTPILAMGNGRVIVAEFTGPFGNTVIIEHTLPSSGGVVYSLYGHLDKISVASGDVTIGQKIGELGDTGPGGLHLHWEVSYRNSFLSAGPYGKGYDSFDEYVVTGKTTIDPSDFVANFKNPVSLFTSNDDDITLPNIGGLFDALGGNDNVVGTTANEFIYGGSGNDVIFDGNGNDKIYGGSDDDYLSATGVNDTDLYDGGTGNDWISYGNAEGRVSINLSTQKVTGTKTGNDILVSIENAQGSNGNDTVKGNSRANILDGRAGNDTLSGGGGNDDLVGLKGNDTLIGGSGHDRARYDYDHEGNGGYKGIIADLKSGTVLDSTGGTDTLSEIEGISGSIFGDTIKGNSVANELSGNEGHDFLFGRGGNDVLIGGDGADQFVFTEILNSLSNVDTIKDFSHLQDDIVLSKIVFKKFGLSLDASELRFGTKALDSDDFMIYDRSTGNVFYDANASATGGQTLFAKVSAGTILTFDDFLII